MRYLALLAGAGALGIAAPALCDPGHGNGHGHGHGHAYGQWEDRGDRGYGSGGCPPGLRRKGCMPPGQAKKLYRGDRYEDDYGTLTSYRRIPFDVRRRYGLTPRYRYYYADGRVYVVNPRTMVIAQIISALLR